MPFSGRWFAQGLVSTHIHCEAPSHCRDPRPIRVFTLVTRASRFCRRVTNVKTPNALQMKQVHAQCTAEFSYRDTIQLIGTGMPSKQFMRGPLVNASVQRTWTHHTTHTVLAWLRPSRFRTHDPGPARLSVRRVTAPRSCGSPISRKFGANDSA